MDREKTYSVTELTKLNWFPIKNYRTVMNHIDSGSLRSFETNSQEDKKIKRLRVKKSDAINFLVWLEEL